MKISFIENKSDPSPTWVDAPDLQAWLKEFATDLPKDESPLWSPCAFSSHSRLEKDTVEVSALVLDFDNGLSGEDSLLGKIGLERYWHTSASHTAEKPKWRLVLPLERPIPSKDWPAFWKSATTNLRLQGADASCKNANRFYFLPPATAAWEAYEGKRLSVDVLQLPSTESNYDAVKAELLAARNVNHLATIRLALAGKPIATPGGRDSAVTALGFYTGKYLVSPETPFAAVESLLSRGLALEGPEPKEHWVEKFSKAFERGRAAKELNRIESTKAQGLEEPWTKQLQTSSRVDGSVTVLSNTYNASVILRNSEFKFRKNKLSDSLEYYIEGDFDTFTDVACTQLANWLQQKYRINVTRQQVYEQADAIAEIYDPIGEFVDSLKWDGVSRVDGFLVDYMGCEDTPQARMFARKWLIGLLARATRPGCKMDNVLVLQGAQGLGKSTALRLLVEPWFSDSKVVVGDKDSMLAASRFWVHEFAELASLKRGDLDTIKAFFTSTNDSYRPPYGRVTVQKPRRTVYVATTNEHEFLVDQTGARRFWVVTVNREIKFDAIIKDRGQILAEARDLLNKGESWWLSTEAERALHSESVSGFQVDPMSAKVEAITQWWGVRPKAARPEYLTVAQVVTEMWNVPLERANRSIEIEAGAALRFLGFEKVRVLNKGHRRWGYFPSGKFLEMPEPKRDGGSDDAISAIDG